ncbi:hypothetical protein VNO77_37281 [Canavalia gladiata]|uniref:cyclin-dependent kinase n=1 Tax=Canavalia gladiata TaxID=3824 RepID=A0AAN9PW13_CANGL
MICQCHLIDLGFLGGKTTWHRCCQGCHPIAERLGCALCDQIIVIHILRRPPLDHISSEQLGPSTMTFVMKQLGPSTMTFVMSSIVRVAMMVDALRSLSRIDRIICNFLWSSNTSISEGISTVNAQFKLYIRHKLSHSLTLSLSLALFAMALEVNEVEDKSDPENSPPAIHSLTLSDGQRNVLGVLYKDFEPIGIGKYGKVFRCTHHLSQQQFAIKVIPITKEEKKYGVPYRIIREISALKELEHPNIVKLEDVLTTEDEVFLVFENLNIDLSEFLRNPSMIMCPSKMRDFMHQILSALAYCHSHKIIHRDLKPSNILLEFSDDDVKIADFGAARTFEDPPSSSYSNDKCSPCYRAPELLLGSTNYSTSVDIWSVGCIFGEMYLGRPLFSSAADSNWEMLREIFDLIGTPTESTWPGVTSLCGSIEALGPPKKPKDPLYYFPTLGPDGVDLISRMLVLCPNYRIPAEMALEHPYFEDN